MKLRTISEIRNLKSKKVLLRVAFDVPLKQKDGKWEVFDDRRIKAVLPTINYLLENQAKIIIMSWLGRPKDKEEKYKMDPVASKLEEILGIKVKKLDDCIGEKVFAEIKNLKSKEIIMLENTRFYKGEMLEDMKLAKEMIRGIDIIVFDAFAQSHRVHASTTGILKLKTGYTGFLIEKELKVLSDLKDSPMRPFVVILGGAKISDKIDLLRYIIKKADIILIGGGPANTFLKSLGYKIGSSLVESKEVRVLKRKKDYCKISKEIYKKALKEKVTMEFYPINSPNGDKIELKKIMLPIDVVICKKLKTGYKDDELKIIKINKNKKLCQDKEAILDIGPYTTNIYSQIIQKARTIFWNGPMGFFENFDFSKGTKEIAIAITKSKGYSVIGGGDTEMIAKLFDLEDGFGHISTGGGASLTYLAGLELPVLKYLIKNR